MVFQGNIRSILVSLASCQDAHATPSATIKHKLSSHTNSVGWSVNPPPFTGLCLTKPIVAPEKENPQFIRGLQLLQYRYTQTNKYHNDYVLKYAAHMHILYSKRVYIYTTDLRWWAMHILIVLYVMQVVLHPWRNLNYPLNHFKSKYFAALQKRFVSSSPPLLVQGLIVNCARSFINIVGVRVECPEFSSIILWYS
jgi:hypothetical protein